MPLRCCCDVAVIEEAPHNLHTPIPPPSSPHPLLLQTCASLHTMNSNNNVHVIAVYTAKVAQYVLRMFALDKRSLALWRVLCGIVTIYDLLLRYPDIHNHYTDQGVLPRTLTLSNFQNQYWVTFHMISGTDFHMTVLVWIHMVIGFLLTVGM